MKWIQGVGQKGCKTPASSIAPSEWCKQPPEMARILSLHRQPMRPLSNEHQRRKHAHGQRKIRTAEARSPNTTTGRDLSSTPVHAIPVALLMPLMKAKGQQATHLQYQASLAQDEALREQIKASQGILKGNYRTHKTNTCKPNTLETRVHTPPRTINKKRHAAIKVTRDQVKSVIDHNTLFL